MQTVPRTPQRLAKLAETYLLLKDAVIDQGFEWEIEWQRGIQFSAITETDFLREAAWVVLSCGMRESVIRRKFKPVSEAFFLWQSARVIVENARVCKLKALNCFAHRKKLEAIVSIAERVFQMGFESFKTTLMAQGVPFIRSFPFMGPATSYHLAKNIGLDEVKPDRHLTRAAAAAGYNNPRELCEDISRIIGDRVSVVDVVIWRFATIHANYVDWFRQDSCWRAEE